MGFRTSAWFWNNKGLNDVLKSGGIDTVSRRVNGGDNGLVMRREIYNSLLRTM